MPEDWGREPGEGEAANSNGKQSSDPINNNAQFIKCTRGRASGFLEKPCYRFNYILLGGAELLDFTFHLETRIIRKLGE